MRRIFTLFLLLFIVLSSNSFAQNTPVTVEISQEREIIDSQLFIIHRVKKGETLYSISKAYGVSIEQISKDNPEVQSGVREGSQIKIRAQQEKKSMIIHTVRWYETLSSIAKKYGVSEQDIILTNKIVDGKIEVRQQLFIPKEGLQTQAITTPESPTTSTQFAQKEESQKSLETLKQSENEKLKALESEIEQRFNLKGQQLPSYNHYNKIRVKLLLPFDAAQFEQENPPKGQTNNSIDLYQGFLLAITKLNTQFPGISIDLEVIDTKRERVEQIISSGKLQNSDIIIGPLYSEELDPVVRYASHRGIAVVSPIDPNSSYLTQTNPLFFQVTTPTEIQQRGLLNSLNTLSQISLFYEEEENSKESIVPITKEILQSGGIRYKEFSYNILKGRSILPQIEQMLDKTSLNHVVIASNSEAFVSDVLRNLNLLKSRSNYEIVIYGTSRWRSFESVDINYYHQMTLNLPMQYHIDYNREEVKEMIYKYRALFNGEPSPYSFQGYDIATYFLGGMWSYGKAFIDNSSLFKSEQLQSDYLFIKPYPAGGYINSAVRRVIYRPDYSIIDIRTLY